VRAHVVYALPRARNMLAFHAARSRFRGYSFAGDLARTFAGGCAAHAGPRLPFPARHSPFTFYWNAWYVHRHLSHATSSSLFSHTGCLCFRARWDTASEKTRQATPAQHINTCVMPPLRRAAAPRGSCLPSLRLRGATLCTDRTEDLSLIPACHTW